MAVFFFSHQRVWAVIERSEQNYRITLGGHTNRNRLGFEDRFNKLINLLKNPSEARGQ
jgi:hypothetical protein